MVHWGSEDCVPPLPQDTTDAAWRGHLIDWAGVVGLSSVKEDNVEEWMWRMTFLSRTFGHGPGCLMFGTEGGGHRQEYITIPILRRWVGLWTNWSNVKRPEFVKQRLERIAQECDSAVRDELHKASVQESRAKATKKKRKVKA